MDPFARLFDGLARQGPGSDATTRAALLALGPQPAAPRVVELGCGSGAATRVLARELGVAPLALDVRPGALAELRRRFAGEGLEVDAREHDFAAPLPGPFDLLWSEGALYSVGFERALATWRPSLAPDARAAVSECVWLTDRPTPRLHDFWATAYPDMTDVEGTAERARRAGYEVLEARPLPGEDWWSYYRPLEARLEELEREDPEGMAELAAETRDEIALYREFEGEYGYAFFLLRAM